MEGPNDHDWETKIPSGKGSTMTRGDHIRAIPGLGGRAIQGLEEKILIRSTDFMDENEAPGDHS